MSQKTEWSCVCGGMRANIDTGDGSRLICYCDDCQAFARIVGREDWLDDAGGSELFQTTPDRVEITQGADRLACLRLTSKGPLRWSASCCGTPFANTQTTRQVPFASIAVRGMAEPERTGPVVVRANRKFALKRIEGEAGSVRRMVMAFMARALRARLTGRHVQTPFFDREGAPVSPVRRPDAAELRAAYRRPGGG